MYVAAGRRCRRIDVAVGVDPDETDALLLLAIKLGHAAHRSCRNGMIAAENHRNHSFLQGL